ncbi:hypothetical protein EDD66_104275 [Mobilisporobacter senegalensis]|uniref:Lipoprotein n=1 Tax=Mobilisporobacter senegalensis TaxID=1329262 RepID=A0A3N1XUV3_9FIRM|nr:hypothetical protein [Mobilisporobacter senegalensis]ROR28687.1 hypothetical protein EDD66_104275 [Mobilisporobacter senegalensis]
MKRLLVMILLFTLLCTACGKEKSEESKETTKETTQEDQENGTEEVNNTTTENSEQAEETKGDSSERIYEPQFIYDGETIDSYQDSIPTYDIAFDVPNYQSVEEGLTKLHIRSGKLCIAVTFGDEGATGMALEDVFAATEQSFGWAMDSNLEGGKDYHGIDIIEQEEVTINGVDCLRFVGEIDGRSPSAPDDKTLWFRYHVRGYAFVKDDIPVTIIGVTLDNGSDGEDYINQYTEEVDHNVDELMKTLRDKKYFD